MLGIARNNLALEMRKRTTRPSLDGDISTCLASVDTAPLPDEVLEKAETARLVRAALDRLDNREQKVLRAKYLDDLPARTIAQRMGITEKAVHSLLYRARNSLREKLKTLHPLDEEETR
jgi:RNA polymerase sigma factor (sigma-70 family)